MVHPDTALRFISEEVGHGLVATRRIPCGTLIWVEDRLDRAFALEALGALPAAGRETALKYSFYQRPGRLVLCWDHARFIHGGRNAPCIWVRTPPGFSSWDFFDRLLGKAHVVGAPGSGFGPSGEGYFRLTAFGSRSQTEEAIQRIKTRV